MTAYPGSSLGFRLLLISREMIFNCLAQSIIATETAEVHTNSDITPVALDQIIGATLTAYVIFIDHANVRMIQAGDGLRFGLEPSLANRIRREVRWKSLDRDSAVQARIARPI
jgi:hypothetical protein